METAATHLLFKVSHPFRDFLEGEILLISRDLSYDSTREAIYGGVSEGTKMSPPKNYYHKVTINDSDMNKVIGHQGLMPSWVVQFFKDHEPKINTTANADRVVLVERSPQSKAEYWEAQYYQLLNRNLELQKINAQLEHRINLIRNFRDE